MKNKIISKVILLVLIIISTINYTVFSVTSSDYKQQSDNAKQELEQVEGEINSVLQEIENISASINEVEQEVSNLSNELNNLNTSIKDKEKDLEEKQKLLDERLSAAYMNSSNTYLEALFSGGIINFISNYDMIKQIADYDNNLINEVKNTKQQLEEEKTKIESLKTEKETKSAELKTLKSNKQEKVNNLTEEQKQIQSQIEEYDSQMKLLEKKERELAQKQAEEAKRKASANTNEKESPNGTTSNGTGTFQWPVPSSHTITSKYGYRIHPIYGTRKLHAGIDIGAAGGSDIVAADSGTVMLSSFGYNGGYGNYIIINHGNGVTTRYAHCSNLYVSVGETVTKGQRIAAVGSTGSSTGNHCHFEVRINGESKQPLDYL